MDPITLGAVGKGLFELGSTIIDRVLPDEEARDKAKLELMKMEQEGRFEEMRIRMSALIAEAQSPDPWTSRARPSFLYVMYLMILMAIPVGFAQVFNPAAVATFTAGVQAWLNAMPEDLWWLFGTGFLGYAGMRSIEKRKGLAK